MKRLAIAVILALLLLAAGAVALALRDSPQPATVEQAVSEFRTEASAAAPSPFPEAGVYVYETGGYEQIDALGGVRHDYPKRSTITVIRTACGADFRWSVLEGRRTTWRVCSSPRGWLLREVAEEHTFFGRTEKTVYTCRPGALLRPAGDEWNTAWRTRCAAGKTVEAGRGIVVAGGRDTSEIDGRTVRSVHVRLRTTLSRKTRGTGQRDWFFDRETGLPTKLVMRNRTVDPSPIGAVRYEEEVRLFLTSLEPRR